MRNIILTLGLLALPAGVHAQDPDSAYFAQKEVCDNSAAIIDQGPSHPEYIAAVNQIWSCAQKIELFEDLWANATPVLASRLFRMTATVRDLRAYQAAMQAMQDATNPAAVRVAAMGVLGAWLSPGLGLSLGELAVDTIAGVALPRSVWRLNFHGSIAQGPQLLQSGAANSIISAITMIANGDSDELGQMAAQQLLPRISQGTLQPFDPESIHLKYYCGNRMGGLERRGCRRVGIHHRGRGVRSGQHDGPAA